MQSQHAPSVCGGSRRQEGYERNVGRRAVLPLAQFGERVWWMLLQPSNRRLGPLKSRFEQGRYLGPMDGSNTVLIGTASGVVKARTIKRLPPGERWTGSLLDEALGSELTPNAPEDGGGRVGTRAPVLQPHPALYLHWHLKFDRCDERRCAELTLSNFDRDNCPGCAKSRAGRKQAVDHSEQCRSRMETILSTTTEGLERQERARDRFAQAAKETEDEEPQRKRRRPEGEGAQPLAPPQEGCSSSSSSSSALPPPPAPPPLEPPPLAKRSSEQETEMTDATVEEQGASRSTPSRGQQWQQQH